MEHIQRQIHILDDKTNLNKFLKLVFLHTIFSDYNGIKLEIKNRKIIEESSNI